MNITPLVKILNDLKKTMGEIEIIGMSLSSFSVDISFLDKKGEYHFIEVQADIKSLKQNEK